jgi:methionyl-tRNA formyltransferase
MRIVMMGTGPFAVPTLEWLLQSPHDVPALVTRPTPPAKGREKGPLNPMRDLAAERGLPILEPATINAPETIAQVAVLQPDLLVVCDYGQILSREALGIAPLGGINLHASLLPKYRGAAPIHWAILNGDQQTGVSVIHMTPRLDGGPILATRVVDIEPDETMPRLEQRLARLGVDTVRDSIELLSGWDRRSPLGAKQDASQVSKAPRLSKEHGAVDWSRSARDIANQVRALKPWPATFTHWLRPGHPPLRLILDRVGVVQDETLALSGTEPARAPGEVVVSDGQRLIVMTGDGLLSLLAVQPAGKRVMRIDEFLRGYPVRPGQTFGASGKG